MINTRREFGAGLAGIGIGGLALALAFATLGSHLTECAVMGAAGVVAAAAGVILSR